MASTGSRPTGDRRVPVSRLVATILVLFLAVLLAADAAWWFRAQRQLDRGVRQVLASLDGDGWRASARTGARGGWPWSAGVVLRDPAVDAPDGSRWTGEGLTAALFPLRPGMVALEARGTQSLLLRFGDGTALRLRAWASRIAASWPDADPGRIDLSADALHVALGGLGPDDAVQAAALSGTLRAAPGGARLILVLRDLALPAPFGRTDNRVLPAIRLSAVFPGLLGPAGDPPSPARWRAGGGTLVIERLTADWDEASASLSGRTVLDPDGRPTGDLVLLIRRPDLILDRLRDAGLIGGGEEIAVRAVLDVIRMAEGGADGNAPLRLELRVEHGLLSLGSIPLARVPALAKRP